MPDWGGLRAQTISADGVWRYFAADRQRPYPFDMHRTEVYFDNRAVILAYDPGDDLWRLLIQYGGQDRLPERELTAQYDADPARDRLDATYRLRFAAADMVQDYNARSDRTTVQLLVPKVFIQHLQRADALYLDAGNDSIAIPTGGSAKAISQVFAALQPKGNTPAAADAPSRQSILEELLRADAFLKTPDVISNADARAAGEAAQDGDFISDPAASDDELIVTQEDVDLLSRKMSYVSCRDAYRDAVMRWPTDPEPTAAQIEARCGPSPYVETAPKQPVAGRDAGDAMMRYRSCVADLEDLLAIGDLVPTADEIHNACGPVPR